MTCNSFDIARLARVSRTTVSLVCNGRASQDKISLQTQERVMAIVRQTGYAP